MRQLSLILVFFVASLLQAQSQIDTSISLPKTAQGVIHLDIFPIEGVQKANVKSIPVRKSPNETSQLIMLLKSPNDISSRMVDYETDAAVVYGKSYGWYQVQTRFGKGWISIKDSDAFITVENLLKNHMTYLVPEEWNGVLFQSPNHSSKIVKVIPLQKGIKPSDAEFIEWKWSEGQPWIHIKILANSYCDELPILEKEILGWVPAYSEKSFLVMWFYAMGC